MCCGRCGINCSQAWNVYDLLGRSGYCGPVARGGSGTYKRATGLLALLLAPGEIGRWRAAHLNGASPELPRSFPGRRSFRAGASPEPRLLQTRMPACGSWEDSFAGDGLPSSGGRLSDSGDEHCLFTAPRRFQAYKAVMLKDALNPSLPDAMGIFRELYLYWGPASAKNLKHMLADAGDVGKTALDAAEGLATQWGIRQALDKAPRLPIAGTSLALAFRGKVQDDLLFLRVVVALRAMALSSERSLRARAQSKNPLEAQIPALGKPRCPQMDGGG